MGDRHQGRSRVVRLGMPATGELRSVGVQAPLDPGTRWIHDSKT